MIPHEIDYGDVVKRIRDDILHIDIPIKHPLKNLSLYLFTGGEPALIDTGPFHPLLEELVTGALRHAGAADLAHIYLTHSHIDHYGLAARLRAMTGARVAAHREERPRIEDAQGQLSKEYGCYASMSPAMGFPRDIADSVFNLARVWIELSEPCPVDASLKDGQTVRAGDRELRAIHTPGHTAGHLCFYEAGERLLFSGDHLMRTITPNPELYCPPRRGHVTGLGQFLDSLRLLEDYDISCAHPGHGAPIRQVRRRIEFNLQHHQRRLGKTEEAVRDGCRTVWEVALRLFPQIDGAAPNIDHFLALKEALGHLAILEKGGAVVRDGDAMPWAYVPA